MTLPLDHWKTPKEPTAEQCTAQEQVGESDWACWYPQMGGYVGKAVVRRCLTNGDMDACYDVFVWHDGEFPFTEQDGPPKLVHHCSPEQFVRFGQFLLTLEPR